MNFRSLAERSSEYYPNQLTTAATNAATIGHLSNIARTFDPVADQEGTGVKLLEL